MSTEPTSSSGIDFLFNGSIMEAIQQLKNPQSNKEYLLLFITRDSSLLSQFQNDPLAHQFLLTPTLISQHILVGTQDYLNFTHIYPITLIPCVYVLNKQGQPVHIDIHPNPQTFTQQFNQFVPLFNQATSVQSVTVQPTTRVSEPTSFDEDIYGEDAAMLMSPYSHPSTTQPPAVATSNNQTPESSDQTPTRSITYNYDIKQETPEEKRKKLEEYINRTKRRLQPSSSDASDQVELNTPVSASETRASVDVFTIDEQCEEQLQPSTPVESSSPIPSPSIVGNDYQRVKKEWSQKKKEELEYKRKLKEQIKRDRSETSPSPKTLTKTSSFEKPSTTKNTSIAFQLPTGETVKASFQVDQTISQMNQWKNANVENGSSMDMFIAYPRTALLPNENFDRTLQDMQLTPSGKIILSYNAPISNTSAGGESIVGKIGNYIGFLVQLVLVPLTWLWLALFPKPKPPTPQPTNIDDDNNDDDNNDPKNTYDNGNSTQFQYK